MLSFQDELDELNTPFSSEIFSAERHYEKKKMAAISAPETHVPAESLIALDTIINRNSDAVLSQGQILLKKRDCY
jgi:hypothetical protein